ncbi:MAG: lytic murein transglycosylase [Pseudomonadota bacterium]
MKIGVITKNGLLVILFSLLFSGMALAHKDAKDHSHADELSEEKFAMWLDDIYKEALAKDISKATIDKIFPNITLSKRAVELDRRQPHATKSFAAYKKLIVSDLRIKNAKKYYNENKKLLNEVSAKHGVPANFIVALWGIESNFGQNMGSFSIIDALATLSYEGRRASFFKKELFAALKIIDDGHISYDKMYGSWAGAMGQTQFMPTSFLSLAVDQNGDGKKDIWQTKADVFGSIANYLKRSGWKKEQGWGFRVKLPSGFDKSLISSKKVHNLNKLADMGVTLYDGGQISNLANDKVSLVQPDDETNETYLIYNNYKVLLKWNRSLYFATAVGLLADNVDL